MSSDLWGEIASSTGAAGLSPGLSAAERDVLIRMPKTLALEGPKLFQPRSAAADEEDDAKAREPSESLVSNGIRLRQFLASAADHAEQQAAGTLPAGTAPPQMPQVFHENRRHNPFHESLLATRTPFSLGLSTGTRLRPMADRRSAMASLRRSVAAVLSFNGVHSSTSASLQTLAEVVADYMSRLSRRLAEEKESCQLDASDNGFPDVVERVFKEQLGLRSVLAVQEYYERDVREAHAKLVENCQEAVASLSRGTSIGGPHSVSGASGVVGGPGSASSSAIYVVGSTAEGEVPEIHFPSSSEDGGDAVVSAMMIDQGGQQMETGLQMLQSLEQQQQQHQGQLQQSEADGGPMSHDSNSALLLATVSPGSAEAARGKRRRT